MNNNLSHLSHLVPHKKLTMWDKRKYWYKCVRSHNIYICPTVPHIYIVYREKFEEHSQITSEKIIVHITVCVQKMVVWWDETGKRTSTNVYTVPHSVGQEVGRWDKCS